MGQPASFCQWLWSAGSFAWITDESSIPIENVYFMKCVRSRVFAVAVSLLVAFIVPLACMGQKITAIDPNAASSKSVEDLSQALLSRSQLHADAPELVEKAETKD